MCKRSLGNDNEVCVWYVHFEKAFDRINCVNLVANLADIGLDWREEFDEGIEHCCDGWWDTVGSM